MVVRAHIGSVPIAVSRMEISIDESHFGWIREHGILHIPDVRAQNDFPTLGSFHSRTWLAVPLRQQGELIGTLNARRTEVRPFTPAQIKLLETFADQAVIAIENVRLFQELKESLEQQTATSEILGVIASSPTDIQPVLDTVIANAVKLSGATKGHVRRLDDGFLHVVAHYNETPEQIKRLQANPVPLSRSLSILDNRPVHLHDIQQRERIPGFQTFLGARTTLSVPLIRQGTPIGNIMIWREIVDPFSERQIELVKTFADQAVIAIENVRLFKELQERNAELREALEHQTATSEILGVIASSPNDLTPVLETVAQNAARLCEAKSAQVFRIDGNVLRLAANYGELRAGETRPISRGTVSGRAVIERRTIHADDPARTAAAFPESRSASGETRLATPLMREGVAVGVIGIRRTDVRPFTGGQIKLVETFAKQSVIAIENVRLFQELKESLEQQTATSEILGVIASSPTDIQPVLDTVAEHAARLCDASDALIFRVNGDRQERVANFGSMPVLEFPSNSTTRGTPVGRAIIDRQTIHVHDLAAPESEYLDAQNRGVAMGVRTGLVAPLLRENVSIGAIYIRRKEVRPFSERQIKLLETFASQAVIAIENVRLFKEIQERNAELREALEHQTATAEVLDIISRSPTDVQPVLDAIVESVAKVCGIDDVLLRLLDDSNFVSRAHFGPMPVARVEISVDEPQFRWIREHGTLHVPDALAQNDFPMLGTFGGWRTLLVVPLRQHGEIIGNLNARRTEVRPFTAAQIKLLETFADQAVIAIENVRLFQELEARNRDLTEALEQQTATGEVLRVIASSPTELQPVLDTLLASAVKLAGAKQGHIRQSDGEFLRVVAHYNESPERIAVLQSNPLPLDPNIPGARAFLDRKPNHLIDARLHAADAQFIARQTIPTSSDSGVRTLLAVPLL